MSYPPSYQGGGYRPPQRPQMPQPQMPHQSSQAAQARARMEQMSQSQQAQIQSGQAAHALSYAANQNANAYYVPQNVRSMSQQQYYSAPQGNPAPSAPSSLPNGSYYQQQQPSPQQQYYTPPQLSPQLPTNYHTSPQTPQQPIYQGRVAIENWQQQVEHSVRPSNQYSALSNGLQPNSYSNVNFAQQQSDGYLPQQSYLGQQSSWFSESDKPFPRQTITQVTGQNLSRRPSQTLNQDAYKKQASTQSVVNAHPAQTTARPSSTQGLAPLGSAQQSHQPQPPPVHDRDVVNMPKRRKSNDGTAISQRVNTGAGDAVKQEVPPHPRTMPVATPNTQATSVYFTPPTQHTHQSKQAVSKPKREESDHATMEVLLSLGNEYISAAHNLTWSMKDSDLKQYQKLISTGIACLKSALEDFRHKDARTEARIRLKLATLLFEESDEYAEAIDVLGKGIAACERAGLADLRCTLQYMLIRVMHKTNPQSAIKIADKIINDVETMQWNHWVFAFRLLRVSLNTDETSIENVAIHRQLSAISELAQKSGLIALEVLSSCLEASTRLCIGTTESYEQAQRNLAAVRQHQLHPDLDKSPQLRALLSMLSMACAITVANSDQMVTMLSTMQADQEKCSKLEGWRKDGTFIVPVGKKMSDHFLEDTAGLFEAIGGGNFGLALTWMSKGSMLTLGYVLSCFATLPKSGETQKAEAFLREGIKILGAVKTAVHGSYKANIAAKAHQEDLAVTLDLLMVATLAARAEYKQALDVLKVVHKDIRRLGVDYEPYRDRVQFYNAVLFQGLGQLQQALTLYGRWHHELDPEEKIPSMQKDIHVLAILNSIHIMRVLTPNKIEVARAQMESIQSYCEDHPNKAFISAFHIIQSTTAAADTQIVTLKKSLNQALTPAQTIKNRQLLALIMSKLSDMFFTDVVGSQAIKSSNAARTLARQAGDSLWVAVGCGMLRDTYENSGQRKEALEANRSALDAVSEVPDGVRDALSLYGYEDPVM